MDFDLNLDLILTELWGSRDGKDGLCDDNAVENDLKTMLLEVVEQALRVERVTLRIIDVVKVTKGGKTITGDLTQ